MQNDDLLEKIREDLKTALRQGDKVRLAALRAVVSSVGYAGMEKGKTLQNPDVQAVIAKEAKQRRESIEAFAKGNRQDLVDKEREELAVLVSYLPQQMSREEIAALAGKVIAEVGARGPSDKGKVMAKLMPQVKAKADGQVVNEVVADLLAKVT